MDHPPNVTVSFTLPENADLLGDHHLVELDAAIRQAMKEGTPLGVEGPRNAGRYLLARATTMAPALLREVRKVRDLKWIKLAAAEIAGDPSCNNAERIAAVIEAQLNAAKSGPYTWHGYGSQKSPAP